MVIESSLTQEIWGKKKLQLDYLSPESSLTQGDSDLESTSVSSSMQISIPSATSSLDQNSSNVNGESHQNEILNKSISKRFATFGSFISSRRRSQSKLSQSSINMSDNSSSNISQSSSISSATSSLNQNSSNVNGESHQNETLKKSISKRFANFGSFISSRRRAQSKLSQSSINMSDNSSANISQSSSIEVSDESSNYVQKPMPKFTRTGSLRSVKILRSKSKNRSTLKSKKTSINKKSEISEESHLERATFSSILKDSKFPTDLKHQPRPLEPEEVLPVAKVCPYQHCSLHGHHHHNHMIPHKSDLNILNDALQRTKRSRSPKVNPWIKVLSRKKKSKQQKRLLMKLMTL